MDKILKIFAEPNHWLFLNINKSGVAPFLEIETSNCNLNIYYDDLLKLQGFLNTHLGERNPGW